ncbi:hypothetical protein ACWKSP_26450 [Micromonosporaceae bacterium Da 78-11]
MNTPDPQPPTSPDQTLAQVFHQWLNSRPRHHQRLQKAVEQWLVAKGL